MSALTSEESLKRQYIIELIDPLRREQKYSTMTVSELEKELNKETDSIKLINPQKFLRIYKSDLGHIREDELAKKEYLVERKRIELSQMEGVLLRKMQELDQREMRLKEREMKLKLSPNYQSPSFVPPPPQPIPYYRSPEPVYRKPDPVYRERLIDDSNEDEEYQRAINESLEESLKVNVDSLKDVEVTLDEDECDIDIPDILDSKSKYDFLPNKPKSMTDDILDELHEILKKEDPIEVRKFLANSKLISPSYTQWILSLELNGTKFKQLLTSKNLSGVAKILEKPN